MPSFTTSSYQERSFCPARNRLVVIGHLFDQDAPYITVWRYLERSCAGERQCRAGDDIDDVDARIALKVNMTFPLSWCRPMAFLAGGLRKYTHHRLRYKMKVGCPLSLFQHSFSLNRQHQKKHWKCRQSTLLIISIRCILTSSSSSDTNFQRIPVGGNPRVYGVRTLDFIPE